MIVEKIHNTRHISYVSLVVEDGYNSDEHNTKVVETVRYSPLNCTGQYKKLVQHNFKFTL